MARISWSQPGERVFETGIDRGVLYVTGKPGVPWTGLVNVNQTQSGGQVKRRYRDGIQIGNRTSPEDFAASIEAYTYPVEFERCDGTYRAENGLRVTQQRRRPFNMTYRSKIGNDVDGLTHGYKIHFLYNLKAQPSDHGYKTLTNNAEPMTFNWKVSAAAVAVSGYRPTAHFWIDSRDIPAELLQTIEDKLYGTDTTDAALPDPGELMFLFDSFEDAVYDAGDPYTPVFVTYDAGTPATSVTETIDGGAL